MQRAAGAIVNAVIGAVIALATDATSKPSPALRIFIAAGALAAVYLILTSRTLISRFPPLARIPGAPSPSSATVTPVSKDQSINITTHNQSGGTNIGKLNVQGPKPGITNGEELVRNEKTSEGYKSVVAINLRDQFAAEAFEVEVNGATITQFSVEPDMPASTYTQSEVPLTPQGGAIMVHPPLHSRYLITILTEQPDPDLKIKPQLRVSE